MSLAKMTGLLGSKYSNETANNQIVKVQNAEITISDLAIQFGRNYKGQLAAVVLFAVANEHGNILRDGWKYVRICIISFQSKYIFFVVII